MNGFGLWFCFAFFLASTQIEAEMLHKHFGPPIEPSDAKAVQPSWGWVQQRVDHFNPLDDRTWKMRYLNNSQFFKPGGPLLIYIGGEWVIQAETLMNGQIFDLAQKHNGYMFYTEHRFYGESYPINDLTTKSMLYLSDDQALADLSYFIEHQKATIPGLAKSKVVVVGCSYAGSLATWARIKYPHVINAAYASSGPLQAIDDYAGFYEVLGQQILRNSQQCYNVIEEAIGQTETLMKTPEGQKNVSQLYFTCSQVKNTEPDRSWFFYTIGEVFADLVQHAKVGQIAGECKKLLAYPGSSLHKLSSYYKAQFKGKCADVYPEFVKKIGSSTKTTQLVHRQFYYQSCTEYGFFQATTSKKQPFRNTFPMSLFRSLCKDLFGKEYTVDVLHRAIKRTNLFYGSTNPDVTKLISVHGNADPWHLIGVLRNISDTAQSILVDGTAHCKDLSAPSPSDLPQMKAAKLRAQELISKWIK